jgi:hypothetical protein
MKSFLHFLPLSAVALMLSGCVIAMGNRDLGQPRATSPTLGQQLVDLKKARDAGALTEAEYEQQRQKLLDEKNRK